MKLCVLVLSTVLSSVRTSELLIVDNGGRGESPPPLGDLIRVDTATGRKSMVVSNLEDPVWVAAKDNFAYVGLFHAGSIVRIDLRTGAERIVATGLSCPEGVGVDASGFLYTVENPVGNECQQEIRKPAGQLTRINITSGEQTKVAPLESPHGMAVDGTIAYVCESGAGQVTKVDLQTGLKERVAAMRDNSGCAVSGGHVFAIEEGSVGQLVKISITSGAKTVLIESLSAPMGVAVDESEGFVYAGERAKNQVQRVPIVGGNAEVFIGSLNSNIGMAIVPSTPILIYM